MNAYLINSYNLKIKGYIHENVDDSILSTLIIRVQDTMLMPIIGTRLFKRLLEGVNNDDLNADEVTLVDDYITPFIVSACDYRSVNALTYQIRNKTVGITTDEHIRGVDSNEREDFKDDLRKDWQHYRNQLIGYLKDNYTLYPEYENPNVSHEYKAPEKLGGNKSTIRFI